MHKSKYVAALGSLLLLASLTLAACTGETPSPTPQPSPTPDVGPSSAPVPAGFANPDVLVDTAWLARRLEDPNVRVLDTRASDKYQEGHIPGAVSIPTSQFTATVNDIPNMVPGPESFATTMAQAGVGASTHVVIVDG